ncbi:MAG: family 1 encapsulin nanocompartment shell protein [Acidimicrobiia bacterium]
MNHLFRELAPITAAGWTAIEEEAGQTLRTYLAARKLVDFSGPHGWEHSAVDLGRVEAIKAPQADVGAALRTVQPLVELRTDFTVSRAELDAIERGSQAPDLDPVRDAAVRLAEAEDKAIFHGNTAAGIDGLTTASTHDPLAIPESYTDYPRPVAQAVARLRSAGVDGPYGIALGPRCYTGVVETTDGGHPIYNHLRMILDGPIVWAPAVDGAVVMSIRGGDFELVAGQDASIGFASHDAGGVSLYLQESITFRVNTPEAAIALVYAKKK